ncbi:MAG: ribosome-binding factor A [Planctomycetota bacterium]
MRSADVYLSIFGKHLSSEGEGGATEPAGDAGLNKTFLAIAHAKSKIQSLVANRLHSKFCPVLHFHTDEKFKKTMETMRLIEQASQELKGEDSADEQVE